MTQPPLTEKAVLITDLQLGRTQVYVVDFAACNPSLTLLRLEPHGPVLHTEFPWTTVLCFLDYHQQKKNIQVNFCQFSNQRSNMILQKPTEGHLVNDLIGSNASSIMENKIAITNRDTIRRVLKCEYCKVTNLHKMKQYNIGL